MAGSGDDRVSGSSRARTGAKRERHFAATATSSTRCKLRMAMAVLELFPAIATATGQQIAR